MRATVVLSAVGILALWLAFQHKPGWYRPAVLDEPTLRRARSESVATADQVSDRLVKREAFELTLTDRSVNEWLAALPELWPEARDAWPPELSQPAVRFGEGTVRLGVHFEYEGWRAIIGVSLSVGVSADGQSLTVKLNAASGGSLPAPRTLLDRILDPQLDRLSRRRDARGQPHDIWASSLAKVRSTADLYDGVTVRNRFIWFNGRRPFRIAAIEVGGGELRLRIEPM